MRSDVAREAGEPEADFTTRRSLPLDLISVAPAWPSETRKQRKCCVDCLGIVREVNGHGWAKVANRNASEVSTT